MRPTFIACTARSGSTLLRWLIDSHPQVACPSETDVAQMLASAERFYAAWLGPDDRQGTIQHRRQLESWVNEELLRRRKTVWCDKSLSNALNLDLLARTWMTARFIFLHRHVMDFIASALAAQPWGLTDYGLTSAAGMGPGNDIGNLAVYWLERTRAMLMFEQSTGHHTVRVRYEDLVARPEETLRPLWDLLGVTAAPPAPMAALSRDHDAHGSADHKIWFTDRVSVGSVDTGARVPAGRINGRLRMEVNDALEQLGYRTLDDAWGAGEPPADGELRIVSGHTVISRRPWSHEGTVVVEQVVVQSLVAGTVNIGAALRSRDVRYYGPPVATYGEERAAFGSLPQELVN